MSDPWLTLLGIGDNGLASLTAEARSVLEASTVVVVSERLGSLVSELAANPGFQDAPSSGLSGHLLPAGEKREHAAAAETSSPRRGEGGAHAPGEGAARPALAVRAISPLEGEMSGRTEGGGRTPKTILTWSDGYRETLDRILALRGTPVTILATGDPMHFGIGATLRKHVGAEEMRILPSPSAFSLAAARLGWPLQNIACITLHGRPVAHLHRHVFPGARIVALTSDGATIRQAAEILVARGFGLSVLHVLEHMGGKAERTLRMTAQEIAAADIIFADFNTLAIDCAADGPVLPLVAGLPDDAFRHDGQLTKREIRAATLALLAPYPHALLWDIGAGCGSIAIEWMRAGGRAIAVESKPERLAMIAENAERLGVPDLEITDGQAPSILHDLKRPDAVFIGGGLTGEGVFEAAWAALKPGGCLVANAVTLEGEARLVELRGRHGGELSRISVARAAPVGRYCGWKSLMPVTLWRVQKERVE